MVKSCSVVHCTNRQGRDEGVSFHSIPAIIEHQGEKTKELSVRKRQAWLSAINRKDWIPSQSSRVCSVHFCSGKAAVIESI